MPELPEVETIRRQLEPRLTGRTITGIDILDAKVTAPAAISQFKKQLRGRKVESVGRRGKYLLIGLDRGETLVIHLRMTGVLTHVPGEPAALDLSRKPGGSSAGEPSGIPGVPYWAAASAAPTVTKPPRLVLHFEDGASLLFHDTRRFGTALVLSAAASINYWDRLGPEPLERGFDAHYLRQALCGRKRPIKSVLLDQALIAGIGNIYADESLFAARIHPMRPAGELNDDEILALTKAIKATLKRAVRLEGSSIDTYRDSVGRRGRFQETFRVHRRQGEPCPGCKDTVQKIKVGGRGTYFCPSCQKI